MAKKKNNNPPNVLIKKIPRNQFGHCTIDPLLKYMYKYNWHLYCLSFTVIDLETKRKIPPMFSILEVMNFLVQPGRDNLYPNGMPDFGIPIVPEGIVNTHAPLKIGDDANLDPYFHCVITVNFMGTTEKPKSGHVEVFYNKA